MNKIRKRIIKAIFKDILLVFISLFIACLFKEGSHYLLALYYNLEPCLEIATTYIGTCAKFSGDIFIDRMMSVIGSLVNIALAIISFLTLFILQVYLPKKDSMIHFYNKDLHKLLGKKYGFLIGGYIDLRLFLLIFALANLLITFFTLLLYPYQGFF